MYALPGNTGLNSGKPVCEPATVAALTKGQWTALARRAVLGLLEEASAAVGMEI